jgi:putative membrane protein
MIVRLIITAVILAILAMAIDIGESARATASIDLRYLALVLGLVNAVVRPVLVLLTLPVTILTLGLFIFVLNGLLFWMVGSWLEGFWVGGFWAGVLGAIVFSIISWALSALVLR